MQMYRFLKGANPTLIALKRQSCGKGLHFHMTIDRGPICSQWKILSGDKEWAAAHPGG